MYKPVGIVDLAFSSILYYLVIDFPWLNTRTHTTHTPSMCAQWEVFSSQCNNAFVNLQGVLNYIFTQYNTSKCTNDLLTTGKL
jgi:hypothetical protein